MLAYTGVPHVVDHACGRRVDVTGLSEMLGAFDYTEDGEVKGEMERHPELLWNSAKTVSGDCIEVEDPHKQLQLGQRELVRGKNGLTSIRMIQKI